MRARLRMPAVSKSLTFRLRHSQSTEMVSRVMPASGPVSSRSSPIMRLTSVDLPAFGRPMMVTRSGRCRSIGMPPPRAPRGGEHPPRRSSSSSSGSSGMNGAERLEQIGRALAMLGRERHGIAEAERVGLDDAALCPVLPSALLASRMTGLPERRTRSAKGWSIGVRPSAGVDHEEDDIGLGDRGLGLGPHAAEERVLVGLFETGGVDDREAEMAERGIALAAIARHARPVVDQRELLADEPVEQRRLADIGPADDGDDGCHQTSHSIVTPARRHCRSGATEALGAELRFSSLP